MEKKFNNLYNKIVNDILHLQHKNDLNNIIWKTFFDKNLKCKKNCGVGLKILLLNAPCNGFGDLIFALKLSNYLKEWYNAEVILATTLEKGLLNLGADPNYTVGLIGGKKSQCRRFRYMKLNKDIPIQDLILVAPMQIDFFPNLDDVKAIIPYSNRFNTFYFSEYNDNIDKNFTFNTGIGKNRDGIFLTKPLKSVGKPLGLKNPYSLIYVAESIDNVDKCIFSFIEMISVKYYKKYKNLDIIIPKWFVDNEDLIHKIYKNISKYYPNINLVKKNSDTIEKIIISESNFKTDNTLTFRCDILPVANKVMLDLMSKSINDILLTGDQSISDALSCCNKKNIFYQIAPWKKDFAKNLAKELPNSYLKNVKTSCGSLKAIKYHSEYENFNKKWDFKTRSKNKMDAIILSIIAIKNNKNIQELVKISDKSTLRSLQNKLINKTIQV